MEEQDTRCADLIQSLEEELETIDEEIKMLLERREAMAKWQAALRRGSMEWVPLPPYPPRF
jgi:archaellum component FlaC